MDTPFNTLLFEVDNHVAQITLNRPQGANAISLELARELMSAALKCDENPAVRAVLIKGAGPLFCAGGDLKEFSGKGDGLADHLKTVTAYLHGAMSILARMDAPTVAAVHGSAAGAGLSLAAACDIVLAAESTRFTLAYTRLGLSPDGGVTHLLPRVIGWKRAMELMLTNRIFSAREAMDWGIVTRVVAEGDVFEEAGNIAAELAKGPTRAFGQVKRLLQSSGTESFESQMSLERQYICEMAETEDAKKGIAAFLNKQKADFKGK